PPSAPTTGETILDGFPAPPADLAAREDRWYRTVRWWSVVAWNEAVARSRASRPPAARPRTYPSLAAAPASPSPAVSYSGLSCGPAVDGLLRRYFGDVYAWAERIVHRESNCQPGAYNGREGCGNGSHASGLFQLCFPMHSRLLAAAGCGSVFDA